MVRKSQSRSIKSVKISNLMQILDIEAIKDQIQELRMETGTSISNAILVSILALLLFIGTPSVFPEIINPYLPSSLRIMQAFIAVPVVYFLSVFLGNMVRYYKILKLQEKLSSKK